MSEKVKKEGNWFKRHKVLSIVLGVFILIIVVGALSGDSGQTNSSQQNNATTKSDTKVTAQNAKIGEPARDGKFEFTVKSVACGKSNVGSDYTTTTAQGQYCLMTLSVKNIGNEPQSLFSDNQFLFNSSNQKYAVDSQATIYYSPANSDVWIKEINPGNTVEGVLVFDLPKDQQPVLAELHDSAYSNGVKISL